jgi:DNA-binding XRE family transcriptional regulator
LPVSEASSTVGNKSAAWLAGDDGDYYVPLATQTKLEIELPRKPSLSRHLRNARIERGLTVASVAEEVGVSTVSIYLWELGRTKPRAENLSALCRILKLPVKATRAIAAG